GGQTYPVSYNKDAGYWQLQPREGWPNTRNMSIDSKGNWQVDLDKGLVGGTGPRRLYSQTTAAAMFDRFEQGYSLYDVSREFNISNNMPKEWISRYVAESGDIAPLNLGFGNGQRTVMASGERAYCRLISGQSLSEVATALFDGDEFAAYRSASRYARTTNLPTGSFSQNRPWRMPQRPGTADIVNPPQQYPMTEAQGDPYPAGKPPLKRTHADPAELDPQQPGTSGAIQQPQFKRPRPDLDEPWSPQPGTSRAAQDQGPATSWGSAQLRQFTEDHEALSGPEADSIDMWLEGQVSAPPSLAAELTARGFRDITPEEVHTYLTGRGPELTDLQMQRITAFLGL
ncbi:hypothetical protein QCE63_35425, partial [Caballeronia sp. LZ065]|uniref:hypothetical protein n=1 Tax=Caballeronia sp. LZ065 TaxID=3038571 RepID=UPI002863FCF6